MADEKSRPFERPEDLGEPTNELGANAASAGAGARASEETESEIIGAPAHPRVNAGEDSLGFPDADATKVDIGHITSDDTVDEDTERAFRAEVNALHEERRRQRKAG